MKRGSPLASRVLVDTVGTVSIFPFFMLSMSFFQFVTNFNHAKGNKKAKEKTI